MKPQDMHALAAGLMMAAIPRTTEPAPMAHKVDQLGAIRAELARLKAEADKIRAELEEAGLPTIEGTLYRASFATVTPAPVTDWQAIAKRFKPSAQLIRAYTKQPDSHGRMTLTAKTH